MSSDITVFSRFAYSMFGLTVGNLKVFLRKDDGTTTEIFNKSRGQGPRWYTFTQELPPSTTLQVKPFTWMHTNINACTLGQYHHLTHLHGVSSSGNAAYYSLASIGQCPANERFYRWVALSRLADA